MTPLITQIQDQQPHVRQVLIEFLELQEKVRALRAFLSGKEILALNAMDQNVLFEQYRVMGMYLSILETRLERFPK